MSVQLFSFSHQFYRTTYVLYTLGSKMLEGNLATIGVEVHTIIGCSIAVCRQRVVGTTGIVASTLTSIRT